MVQDSTDYLRKIYDQAIKYYVAEKAYYEKKNIFIVSIAFGWIREAELMNEAKEWFKKPNDRSTDFCYLYGEGENGFWVYGKAFDPKVS